MRVLRFVPGSKAEPIPAGDLPPAPGGGIWCDLARGDLGDDGPLAAWLGHLHPLLRIRLGERDSGHLAVAAEDHLHIRLAALLGPAPVPDPTAAASGPDLRGPEPTRLPRTLYDVVLGAGFVVTVRDAEPDGTDQVWRAYAEGECQADTPHFAAYQALGAIVADYRQAVERLTAAAERVGQRLVELRARSVLTDIVGVRRHALDLRDVVGGGLEGLRLLAEGGSESPVPKADRPYFTDLRRQAAKVLAETEAARATMGEAVEAFTSVQSTEMNRVMQIFTVLAVLFAPPTLIASIYGMNFRIPEYHWALGYPWALGLMLAVTTAVYTLMRGRRWL